LRPRKTCLAAILTTLGIFARRNGNVITTVAICALSSTSLDWTVDPQWIFDGIWKTGPSTPAVVVMEARLADRAR
jgi:hypothetical protein